MRHLDDDEIKTIMTIRMIATKKMPIAHLMKTPCRNSRGPQSATIVQCTIVKDSEMVKCSNGSVQGSVEQSKIHCDEGKCSAVQYLCINSARAVGAVGAWEDRRTDNSQGDANREGVISAHYTVPLAQQSLNWQFSPKSPEVGQNPSTK